MPFTPQQTARAQARLAAVEPLIANVGSLYELIANGALTDPEVIAVFTAVIADQKATITSYLTALTDAGDPNPLDQPAATVGRLRIEQAKGVLSHLQRALPALSAPIAANVAVTAMVNCWIRLSSMPMACAMKMAAAASYNAVPSMLIVDPSGMTNSVDRFDTPALVMAHSIVTGSVADELAVENAVNKACDMFIRKRYGFFRVTIQ